MKEQKLALITERITFMTSGKFCSGAMKEGKHIRNLGVSG